MIGPTIGSHTGNWTRSPDSYSFDLTVDGAHWRGVSLKAARTSVDITEPQQPGQLYGNHHYCVRISVDDGRMNVERLRPLDVTVNEHALTLRDENGRQRAQIWLENGLLNVVCADEQGASVAPQDTFLP